MASLKSIALAAEQQQADSGNGRAFRLGILFSLAQMAQHVEARIRADGELLGEEAFGLYCEMHEWLFAIEAYLAEADRE